MKAKNFFGWNSLFWDKVTSKYIVTWRKLSWSWDNLQGIMKGKCWTKREKYIRDIHSQSKTVWFNNYGVFGDGCLPACHPYKGQQLSQNRTCLLTENHGQCYYGKVLLEKYNHHHCGAEHAMYQCQLMLHFIYKY